MIVSPTQMLDTYLIASPNTIAPEKAIALDEYLKKYCVTFIFTDDKKFSFRVDTNSKKIKLPRGALEYLWCACYAFYVTYKEYTAANLAATSKLESLKNRTFAEALSLYKWGIDQLTNIPRKAWPCDKPKPELTDSVNEDIQVVNDLYLCAAAWIIHHELAHIFCGHQNEPINNDESRKQETEADKSATQWILEGVLDDKVRDKRGLGVAIAVLVLTAQDILSGTFREETHPKSFQRLYDAITPYFKCSDHLVYAFSTAICHMNMALVDIEISRNDNETWQQNLESCLIQLNSLKKS